METLASVQDVRRWRASCTGTVGFVPTMGALHEGHGSLIAQSIATCDHTVVSIYVNPTQFNNPNDLDTYPDTLADDVALVTSLGGDAVFTPDYSVIYPDDFAYLVDETKFSHELCGEHRPGHFTGVLTVVMKLLNIIRPDQAFFGEKDYQQYLLIRGMAEAFFLETEIVPGTTVREADGLAMSSRNLNLAPADRALAPRFNHWLRSDLDDAGVTEALSSEGFVVDYIRTRQGRRFGAVTLGPAERPVRLIDNVALANAATPAANLKEKQ